MLLLPLYLPTDITRHISQYSNTATNAQRILHRLAAKPPVGYPMPCIRPQFVIQLLQLLDTGAKQTLLETAYILSIYLGPQASLNLNCFQSSLPLSVNSFLHSLHLQNGQSFACAAVSRTACPQARAASAEGSAILLLHCFRVHGTQTFGAPFPPRPVPLSGAAVLLLSCTCADADGAATPPSPAAACCCIAAMPTSAACAANA